MILPRFDFEAPTDLRAACDLLGEGGEDACLLAGGTDLLVKMKRGLLRPRLVLSLSRVEGIDGIDGSADGELMVGPLTTMAQLEDSPLLQGPWQALAEGAASVGGPIIRNRATVGGNIVNARPCADSVPPLMVLDARLALQSRRGQRTVELDGFITGPGESQIERDEILTGILLPRPSGPTGSCYQTASRRAAMEVTVVGCAASVTLDDGGATVKQARVVLTSVAPILLRVPGAEAALVGQSPGDAACRAAAAAARQAASPIDDHRAPGAYRSEVVEVLTRRALTVAIERARQPGGRLS